MKHPLEIQYGPLDGWIILLIMGGLSISFFSYQVIKATRLVMLGAPDNRFDSWGLRIKEMLVGWLGQKKVLRDKIAGTMHVLMFLCNSTLCIDQLLSPSGVNSLVS